MALSAHSLSGGTRRLGLGGLSSRRKTAYHARLSRPSRCSAPLSRRRFMASSSSEHHTSHDDHHHHESPYDPPGGWLFGVPPGQKYQKEGWEDIWVYGFWGSLLFGAVAYVYKPDTSIQTWALEEARRRLEVEGILEDPSPDLK